MISYKSFNLSNPPLGTNFLTWTKEVHSLLLTVTGCSPRTTAAEEVAANNACGLCAELQFLTPAFWESLQAIITSSEVFCCCCCCSINALSLLLRLLHIYTKSNRVGKPRQHSSVDIFVITPMIPLVDLYNLTALTF